MKDNRKIKVFSVQGVEVWNNNGNPAASEGTADLSRQGSGIYFLHLEWNDQVLIRKLDRL